jgi:hypothetical protein
VLDEASAAGTLDAKSLKSTKEVYAERRAVMVLVKETKNVGGRICNRGR